MGADAAGELNAGRYSAELLHTSSEELGYTGKLNITSTYEALEDFLAEYEMSVSFTFATSYCGCGRMTSNDFLTQV